MEAARSRAWCPVSRRGSRAANIYLFTHAIHIDATVCTFPRSRETYGGLRRRRFSARRLPVNTTVIHRQQQLRHSEASREHLFRFAKIFPIAEWRCRVATGDSAVRENTFDDGSAFDTTGETFAEETRGRWNIRIPMRINSVRQSTVVSHREIFASTWASPRPPPAPPGERVRGLEDRDGVVCDILHHRSDPSTKLWRGGDGILEIYRQLVSWSKYTLCNCWRRITVLGSPRGSRAPIGGTKERRSFTPYFGSLLRLVEFASIISRAVPSGWNRAT